MQLRIPICAGVKVETVDGIDYDCTYPKAGAINCEDCLCNFYTTGGTFSPVSGKQSKVALKLIKEGSYGSKQKST